MDGPPLHPQVAPLAFLVGRWSGEGKGEYPTIQSFAYGEEIHVWHVGKPFLAYAQRTWHLDDARPLHAECGYWRLSPDGRVELVLAHPTGVVEVAEGELHGTSITVETTAVERTSSAKEITALSRRIEVDGDELRYSLSMAAVGLPLTPHLVASLQRA